MKEKVSVLDIKNNLKDYKVCRMCGAYNRKENTECHNWLCKRPFIFECDPDKILILINEEIKIQLQEKEVLTEKELIDNIVSIDNQILQLD